MNKYLEQIKHLGHKYLIEIILIVTALVLAIGSLLIFFNSTTSTPSAEGVTFSEEEKEPVAQKIYAEISGAVVKPGVYELKSDSRLKELLELAKGLSDKADKAYFSRNFNLARLVQDQEKIYVPSVSEVSLGIFVESSAGQIANSSSQTATADTSGKINLNTASAEQLDSLPGVGEVTAQKIIDGRPYSSVEELSSKKIVSQNVYEQIKDQVAAP